MKTRSRNLQAQVLTVKEVLACLPSLPPHDIARLFELILRELVGQRLCSSEFAEDLRRVVIPRETASDVVNRVIKSVRQNLETLSLP